MDRLSKSKAIPTKGNGQFRRDHAPESTRLEDLLLESIPNDPRKLETTQWQHQAAVRSLEQLSVAAQSFAIQLDYDKLLVEIAEHAFRIVPVEQVTIYSNMQGRLETKLCLPKSAELPAPSEDVKRCVRYLKPATSTLSEARHDPVRNCLCVPLVGTQNRVLAVIEFQNKATGGEFTLQDQRVTLALARIATSALDRALLFFRIDEWQKSMEMLFAFNATVKQQLSPEEMVRELVVDVTGFLGAQGGIAGIAIRTEEGTHLECEGFYFQNQWNEFSRRWTRGQGIPGMVLETQFPYVSRNYLSDQLRERDLADGFALGSCICVPIKNLKEDVLGFFQLLRREGEPEFTWQDAVFLESLGNSAAVAIENARLMKSLELKNEQIKTLSRDHVNRLEEERRHISRELHDETGQVLIGLKLRLQILGELLTDDQAEARAELAELRTHVNRAAVQLKDMAERLRPPTLDELGFEDALRQLVNDFRRKRNIDVHLDLDVAPELTPAGETALYRIVQECLTNSAKHACASCIDITFYGSSQQQVLVIADDGIGFQLDEVSQGLGLVGIRERVDMLGGQLKIFSSLGKGTRVEISFQKRGQE